MTKVILTGGGTAGHVTPNLALIPELRQRGIEIHYIGRKTGIERELLEPLDIAYHSIAAGKLRRYFDLKNAIDMIRVVLGVLQSLSLLFRIRPKLIFSKGGFVSCPVVWSGWLLRIPVIIHESDLTPGLANRLSAPFAKQICYSFPETKEYFPAGKARRTGIPVRRSLLEGNGEAGRRICQFEAAKPAILIIGGSLGSRSINRTVRQALSALLQRYNVCHICGRGNVDPGLADHGGYRQFEYVGEELAHLFAMADVVVARAGATTLFELLALGKPSLLIPLPLGASRGDQILNARSFERQGFCLVLPEEELTPQTLTEKIGLLCKSRRAIAEKIAKAETADAIEAMLNTFDRML